MPESLGNFQMLQTQGRNTGATFAVNNPYQRALAQKRLQAALAAKKGGRTRKMRKGSRKMRARKGKSRRAKC